MEIIIPVLVVLVIGLILGLGLTFADKFMSVPVDEKQSKRRECLPGANCGACGFSGCDGYAAARSDADAPEIDQLVFIPFKKKFRYRPGDRIAVRITAALPGGDLEAELI